MSQPNQTLPGSNDVLGIARNVLRLISNEWALAKEEMSENLRRAGVAIAFLLAGVALSILAMATLLWAGVAALAAAGMPPWLTALILAAALGVLAIGLIAWAMRNLKAKAIAPKCSLNNVQKDLQVLKEVFDG
ncbi:phage holin family protein [Tropicimonas sp. S265A]|uniref:phage holin family protein n=1 Tax=Tropicimonas sp. S265A TaxID=3415134 RepID=UPI003C7D11CE